MSPDAATSVSNDETTDVIADVNKRSNKDAVNAGFCEEPFADSGELLVHFLLTSEAARHTWTLGGDATVLDEYALATTPTTVSC